MVDESEPEPAQSESNRVRIQEADPDSNLIFLYFIMATMMYILKK